MSNSQIFIVAGLSLNTIASMVMLIPYLNSTKNIKDDFISNMDMANGNYTQKKHKKAKKLGLFGFSLFIVGFIFQIIGVLV